MKTLFHARDTSLECQLCFARHATYLAGLVLGGNDSCLTSCLLGALDAPVLCWGFTLVVKPVRRDTGYGNTSHDEC